MPKVECITRTPELVEKLATTITVGDWTISKLAQESGVSRATVHSMLNPGYKSGVSKVLYADVVEALTRRDVQQRIELLGLAGIPVYRLKGSRRLVKLL